MRELENKRGGFCDTAEAAFFLLRGRWFDRRFNFTAVLQRDVQLLSLSPRRRQLAPPARLRRRTRRHSARQPRIDTSQASAAISSGATDGPLCDATGAALPPGAAAFAISAIIA